MSLEQFALLMLVPAGGLLMGATVFLMTRKDRSGNRARPSH